MINSEQAAVEVRIEWQSSDAGHCERYYFDKLNLWRDILPGGLSLTLPQSRGEWVSEDFPAGDLVPPYSDQLVQRIKRKALRLNHSNDTSIALHAGRFYPRKLAAGSAGIFSGDMHPMRLLSVEDETVCIDLNHPLARSALHIATRIGARCDSGEEHGGLCNDIIMDVLAGGAGLQGAMAKGDTDFLAGDPFARMDPREDYLFYQQPRLVQHLDATAIRQIRNIYRRSLKPGMRVLDLMCSWGSHLPEDVAGLNVTGLGMNAEELARNPQLSECVIHDLNRAPELPFENDHFDAVVCTASVEYMVQPVEVFRELGRVLKAGAPAIITVSDRWFPTKAIGLWPELHPFERMGLVLEYFRKAGNFDSLETESVRGLPRPPEDKYAGQRTCADPVFAVRGTATGTGSTPTINRDWHLSSMP